MPERDTAELQLQRLLYTFAAAQGGVSTAELAAKLDTTPQQILRDLAEVMARDFYHPAGHVDAVQVMIEPERVSVFSGRDLNRPVRLAPKEALTLGLGLRSQAMEYTGPERERLIELARRLEKQLASVPVEEMRRTLGVAAGAGSMDGLRRELAEAARRRCPVSIRYVKAGNAAPDDREVEPYVVLVDASGYCYLLANCRRTASPRVFRLDRILEATSLEGTFEPPADFDPSDYINDGRIYRADEEITARVRYTSVVAGWVREQEEVEEEADGSVLVYHRVADPAWLVEHVLRFGGHAEVLYPPELREMVLRGARRIQGVTGRRSIAADSSLPPPRSSLS